jgi:hypothetical protein
MVAPHRRNTDEKLESSQSAPLFLVRVLVVRDTFGHRGEANDDDGHVVLRALLQRVVDEELAGFLRVRHRPDLGHRLLIGRDVPELGG